MWSEARTAETRVFDLHNEFYILGKANVLEHCQCEGHHMHERVGHEYSPNQVSSLPGARVPVLGLTTMIYVFVMVLHLEPILVTSSVYEWCTPHRKRESAVD